MGIRRRFLGWLGQRVDSRPPPPVQRPFPSVVPPRPWTVLDPRLRADINWLLHDDLKTAIDEARPMDVLTALGDGLYRLPLLSPEGLTALQIEFEEIQQAVATGALRLSAPNSMNQAGFQLNEVNLAPLGEALCKDVVQPLSTVFRCMGSLQLADPHAFSVVYGRKADRDLAFHADDASVTLNVCVFSDADGSEVQFEGVRCPEHRQEEASPHEVVVWTPRSGEAVLHLGAHRHRTLPIQSGCRTNLVVWCRDAKRVDLGDCGPWCRTTQPEN